MKDASDNRLREANAKFDRDGAPGMASRLGKAETKHYRTKVFQSGNSIAVRIPAGTKLKAGMEMDLTVEDGENLMLAPFDRPKRKFNIDKVWGSATNLKPIDENDRWFKERELDWGIAGGNKEA